jgi:hypothetical protein
VTTVKGKGSHVKCRWGPRVGTDSHLASSDLDLGGATASPDPGLGPTMSQGGHHYPTPS